MSDATETRVYMPPSLRRYRPLRVPRWQWNENLALAYDLVEALEPRLVAGLGMHWGATYYAICQSVLENDLDTLCYAISRWKEPRGSYGGNDLHDNFVSYGRDLYNGFSYVLRWGPMRGLRHFSDNSVDLIHLGEYFEGTELTENVANIMHAWLAKLRPGGVMFVHDLGPEGTRSRDLWAQWTDEHDTFTLEDETVLGLLRKRGDGGGRQAPLLEMLFSKDAAQQQQMRDLYTHATHYLHIQDRVDANQFGRMRTGDTGKGDTEV